MSDYMELVCFECHEHIGWMTDCGPTGMPICDECKDKEEDDDRD